LLLASRPRWGRLQRQAARAFIALDAEALTSELAEWAWPRQLLLDRRPVTRAQRLSTARAARSIGAVRIRREGREWLWMLPTAGGAAATVTATTGNGGDGDGQLLSQGG
jgi:hypothetical protein